MRHLFVLILYFSIHGFANAETDAPINYKNPIQGNEQLSHKYRMASYLLAHSPLMQRVQSSDDKVAKELILRAENNYQVVKQKIYEQNWLEANAIIDSVLRDLSAGAQLLNVKSTKDSRYHEELRKVDSFVLPEWSDLSEKDRGRTAKTFPPTTASRNSKTAGRPKIEACSKQSEYIR